MPYDQQKLDSLAMFIDLINSDPPSRRRPRGRARGVLLGRSQSLDVR
jgi:hypothetical protein